MRKLLRAVAVAAAVTVVAAGCGDDETAVGAEPAAGDTERPEDAAATHDDHGSDTGEHDDHEMADRSDEHDDHEMADGSGEHDDHDMADGSGEHDDHDDHGTGHEVVEVVPTISIEAVPDPAAGVNVFITTADFVVAPHDASTDHVEGVGHFHLYIDGEKRLRFYNRAIHVDGIPEGDVEISVELSGNDHGAYTTGGDPIRATKTITVPPHEHGAHDHGEPEPLELTGPVPDLSVEVHEDPVSGWNAFIEVDGFLLSGESASGDHVEGEGHIHLYVDDLKLMRLYGSSARVETLPVGEHQIRVALFSNDHRPYVVDGSPVEASTTVIVAA